MMFKTICTGLVAISLCACSLSPGGFLDKSRLTEKPPAQPAAAPATFEVQPIDVAYFQANPPEVAPPAPCPLTCLTPQSRASHAYRIGVNDQLQVIVWDHPELTSQGGGGSTGTAGVPPLPSGGTGGGGTGGGATAGGATSSGGVEPGGLTLRVASDGTVFFPRVGRIKVAGKSPQEVQRLLTDGLRKTIVNPQLDVRVTGFNSQQAQILGDVKLPQAQALTDVPLSIIDAINRAGGANSDADLQNVGVTRGGKRYQVDVASVLETGNVQQNVVLEDGDIVDVPDRTNSRVFVLGEISKPAAVPMNRGKLTLADAIANSGSVDNKTSDPHFIYVIRGIQPPSPGPGSSPKAVPVGAKMTTSVVQPDVFRLDMTQVDALVLMTRFDLQPLDIVYVQIADSARFNRLLDLITPSLQTLFFTKQLAQ
ncbi:polysaccharide biosynthesis/export family protein [Paraburkholderia sp. BL10I2N1]|uniref:polysaccharide biosynthesis/export family protein n=1 Tax=Paraburkholderia sp. BL10I2N1 TaxID=1938796 RepID=UPI00105E02E7|nr:polysaccharide biosynthesis/export family protein [Paraburkholderia sp. BL10I2N1]TDN70560.1 polysaccharide export outer membrane protein [Paraburkholderia sp. BL10I2N1]